MTEPSKEAREVWDSAYCAWDYSESDPCRPDAPDQRAALIIQQYGDQRVAEAEARIVEWLRERWPEGNYGADWPVTFVANAIEHGDHLTTAQSAKEIG